MRGIRRSSRVWLGLLAVVVFGVVAVGAASGSTTVTIGQTSATADYTCESGGEIDFQTAVAAGASYVVPAGPWLLTSWSTYAGTPGGSMTLLILRATAVPGTYAIVAKSQQQQLTAGVMNTFSASFVVRGGDFLGFWSANAKCGTYTQDPADLNPYLSSPEPAVGDTVTPRVFPGYLQNISATITNSKDQCKNGGWQSFGVFKNQGDCVSFLATGGKNPPANG